MDEWRLLDWVLIVACVWFSYRLYRLERK